MSVSAARAAAKRHIDHRGSGWRPRAPV